jgi:hypothetical protein
MADLGGTQQKAPIVGNGLEPFEFPDHLFLQRIEADVVGDDVDGVPDGDPVGELGANDRLHLLPERFVLLQVVLSGLETVEAGRAGNHDVEPLLLSDHQVPRRQRNGEFVVCAVRRRRPAAGPVVDLLGLDAQGMAHRLDGLAVFFCRSVGGTTGIDRNLHLIPPERRR